MPRSSIPLYDDQPEHMIIWLDQHIGNPEQCRHLKKVFSTQMDPKNECPVELFDQYHLEAGDSEYNMSINFDGVNFLLAAFTNIENCIHCFERNRDKRIFFITSDRLGEDAIPIILQRFRKMFTDPVTNEPYMFIYVLGFDKIRAAELAIDYRDYVLIFDFDAVLLVRMIRDIADYYTIQGERLLGEDPPNNVAAYHRLSWAKEFYERYSKMEKYSIRAELSRIDQLLEAVEEELGSSSNEDD